MAIDDHFETSCWWRAEVVDTWTCRGFSTTAEWRTTAGRAVDAGAPPQPPASVRLGARCLPLTPLSSQATLLQATARPWVRSRCMKPLRSGAGEGRCSRRRSPRWERSLSGWLLTEGRGGAIASTTDCCESGQATWHL